ncbi:MAG: DinB family protein [Streptosporangiales bacterium]|nr:DinB family protein [Streptosporangiales bacterium]
MSAAELLTDAFGRIRETVLAVVPGLTTAQLSQRLDPDANTIGWLVWHLTRVQDDHIAGSFGVSQVWTDGGWAARFGLPDTSEIGYGHTSAQVAAVTEKVAAAPDLLTEYHEAVQAETVRHVSAVKDADLSRVVDRNWDPPVTLGVRLVSVVNDGTQHAGQAAFIRGVLLRAD